MPQDKYIYKEISLAEEKISRYFLPMEWAHLPYIDSLFFLESYFRNNEHFNIDRRKLQEYAFNNLQFIFHRLLKEFLQGRLDKYYLNFTTSRLNRYLIFRGVFLNNQYSTKPQIIFQTKNQAKLIIVLYQDLKELKKQFQPSLEKKNIIIANKFDYQNFKNSGWQYSTIHFLEKVIKRKLAGLIDYFLIQGSFATKDFLEDWSDLDALIILSPDVFQNSDNLSELRKIINKLSFLCYKIEPLAHHQFFFLTNFDLTYYPIYLFPPILYDYSLLLSDKSSLDIYLRQDKYRKIQVMAELVNHFRNKVLNNDYSQTMVHWKEDLAKLMLWPSLMLQARDIYLYKKYSFERVKQEFPDINFGLIDDSTTMMRKWSRFNVLRYYPDFLFALLPSRLNQIIIYRYRRYLSHLSLQQSQAEISQFTQKALSFLEKTFNLILEGLKNE